MYSLPTRLMQGMYFVCFSIFHLSLPISSYTCIHIYIYIYFLTFFFIISLLWVNKHNTGKGTSTSINKK